MTDFSIVIVNWNTSVLLRNCLMSLKGSVTDGGELVVVDNASSDSSVEMVRREFPEVILLENTENHGFASANNQGMRVARQEYVLLLNSDTEVSGDAIRRCVEYVEEHPDVGVLGCRVVNPDGSMQSTCFMEPSLLNICLKVTGLFKLPWPRWFGREHMQHWKRDSERDVDVVTGCFMMVRREAIDQVGMMDESFFFCGEETDWCRRFREAGWVVRFAPVGEIMHVGNASGRHFNHTRDVMLTNGIVRFHLKHHGRMSAMAAWTLLWLFNASRSAVWSVVSVFARSEKATLRRRHFRSVVRDFRAAWPGEKVSATW